MKYYIYGAEAEYQGLHGIFDHTVADLENEEEAAEYAVDLSYGVMDTYGASLGYDDSVYEYENDVAEQNVYCYYFPIKDEYQNMDTDELEHLCNDLGPELFEKEYCRKE